MSRVDVLILSARDSQVNAIMPELRSSGFRVRVARRSTEALQVCRDSPPRSVVLDGLLPDGNATLVAKRLRDHGWRAPILLMSTLLRDSSSRRILSDLGVMRTADPVLASAQLAGVHPVEALKRLSAPADPSSSLA